MSIFSQIKQENDLQAPVFEGYIDDSLAGMQEIVTESAQEMYQLQAGMYISDIIMEEAVMEGAATPEILIEGFVKDALAKLEEIFKNLWAKVEAFFKYVIKTLEIAFLSNKKFADKFSDEIKAKNGSDFTYTGHVYTVGAGFAETSKLISTIATSIDETIARTGGTEVTLEEAKTNLNGELGGATQETVLEKARAAFRDGQKDKAVIKGLSNSDKDAFIKLLANGKDDINKLKESQKSAGEAYKKILTNLKKERANAAKSKDDAKAALVSIAKEKYQFVHYAISISNTVYSIQTTSAQAAVKQARKVLGSFLKWKSHKDALDEKSKSVVEEGSTSILESAMRFV